MKVKRYVVDEIPEAMQKIRSDLGPDAVIVSTKPIRQGGLWGWFRKKKFEVVAAADPKPSAPSSVVQARQAEALFASAVERDRALLDEIREMKKLVHRLARQADELASQDGPWSELQSHLVEQDVLPEIARRLVGEAASLLEQEGKDASRVSPEEAKERLKDVLRSALKDRFSEPKGLPPDIRVAQFVGPTGVGKTTTIAKLAAEQALRMRRRVGFITADTYRIAAVEQLKTYATILNAPIEVVFSPLDLPQAFERLKDCDFILMDTAGRNYRHPMFVSEVSSLLRRHEPSRTFLVLSLTSKYRDMKTIADHFTAYGIDQVILTKMDETDAVGSAVNLLSEYPLKLAYVAFGQNVPDDIRPADVEDLISKLLEVPHHG